MQKRIVAMFVLSFLSLLITWRVANAHQPYFEDVDLTAQTAWRYADPTISLAFYGTLEREGDVDYFVFEGKVGQQILLSMVIPVIAGQENFTPTIALMGPGLPTITLPKQVEQPAKSGAILLRADAGKAILFTENFSATNYWRRQKKEFTLPADGRYTVAIWSESNQIGRYTFSPGTREVFGGDPAFGRKLKAYWSSVTVQPTSMPTATKTR